MIDYIHTRIKCNHTNCIGKSHVMTSPVIDPKKINHQLSPIAVIGKYDSKLRIRSILNKKTKEEGQLDTIEIKGNISKFLQGHNLFGINDLNKLMLLTVESLSQKNTFKINPTDEQLNAIKNGNYPITRLDINKNFYLDSYEDANTWCRYARDNTSMKGHHNPISFGTTTYFGRGSKHFEFKIYAKGGEVRNRNSLPESLFQRDEILSYADKLIRMEGKLCSMWLKTNKANKGSYWSEDKVNETIDNLISRIQFNGNFPLSDKNIFKMERHLLPTYFIWLNKFDVKSKLKKSTYFRHKKELLKYDINIDLPPNNLKTTMNLAELLKNEAKIPSWAYEYDLIA